MGLVLRLQMQRQSTDFITKPTANTFLALAPQKLPTYSQHNQAGNSKALPGMHDPLRWIVKYYIPKVAWIANHDQARYANQNKIATA